MPRRIAYAALGLSAVGLAIWVAVTQHSGGWLIVIFAIAPDLSFLAGMGSGLEQGQLHPRAVPIYNAVHRFWVPALMVAGGLVTWSPNWLAAGLAWTAHIGIDRSLGFGLRTPDGFQRV
jgi:hypothetical protein